MAKVYELEIVKPDGTVFLVPDSNHIAQILAEVQFPPHRNGKLPREIAKFLKVETYGELRRQLERYSLTATDPWTLTRN